ncbi:hypothetical protein [Nostoc sp.]|uniref:hypothetical protein n=1 Tax=Nostoc sp. TaxID=1180 RepID=UPI002FF74D53
MKLTVWNHNFAASPNWQDKLAVSPIKHGKQESRKAPDFFRMEQKRFMLVWDRNFRLPICSESEPPLEKLTLKHQKSFSFHSYQQKSKLADFALLWIKMRSQS